MTGKKCKPVHNWKMPEIGDCSLRCMNCGREIMFEDLSINIRSAIVNGRHHFGDTADIEFSRALRAAEDADREALDKRLDARHAALPPLPIDASQYVNSGPRIPSELLFLGAQRKSR